VNPGLPGGGDDQGTGLFGRGDDLVDRQHDGEAPVHAWNRGVGDVFFFVAEAINDKEEEFGEERLLRIITENRDRQAAEIMERILDAITAFAGERPQFDDITLMVLRAL